MKYMKGFGCSAGAVIGLLALFSGIMWMIEHHPTWMLIIMDFRRHRRIHGGLLNSF